jgi:hypothetical protein
MLLLSMVNCSDAVSRNYYNTIGLRDGRNRPMTSLACAATRRSQSFTGNRRDASLESEGLPERSGWSSPGCRDRQGAASEQLIPDLDELGDPGDLGGHDHQRDPRDEPL